MGEVTAFRPLEGAGERCRGRGGVWASSRLKPREGSRAEKRRGAWGGLTCGETLRRAGEAKGHREGGLLEFGAGEESRTPDLRITNALLYQLSYTGLVLSLRF